MVKGAAILLSALVLVQSIRLDMGDLAQLDELLEHARFHADKYGDNFLVFLSKHYGNLQNDHKQSHQEEQSQHEKLPFNHQSCQHLLADFLISGRAIVLLKAAPVLDSSRHFHYQENYAFIEKFDIFQPPRTT